MSKARRKGTDYENYLRDKYLSRVFPNVDRAPLRGVNDRGDFDGVGYYVMEAKKRNRWDLPSWIETTAEKAARDEPGLEHLWMVWFAGDKRKGRNRDDYVVMPAVLATYLLECEQIAQDYIDEVDG